MIPIIKLFVFELIRNLLLTRDKLRRFEINIPGDCPFCNKELETANYIFVTRGFAYNIWTNVSQQCPFPINMNKNIADWLEYNWNCTNIYNKSFSSFMEKVISILWYIWNYIEIIIFLLTKKSNPINIIEQARFYFHSIFNYNKSTDLINQVAMTGKNKNKSNKQVRKIIGSFLLRVGWNGIPMHLILKDEELPP